MHNVAFSKTLLAGSRLTAVSSIGSSALLDSTRKIRERFMEEGRIREDTQRERAPLPSEQDRKNMAHKLHVQGFLKPDGTRARVEDFDGVAMAPEAERLLEVGRERRDKFAAAVRESRWRDYTLPKRHPFKAAEVRKPGTNA